MVNGAKRMPIRDTIFLVVAAGAGFRSEDSR